MLAIKGKGVLDLKQADFSYYLGTIDACISYALTTFTNVLSLIAHLRMTHPFSFLAGSGAQ